jgi:putative ABC transport system permease protein
MSLGFTKILRDLWLNRARTILVVLAIALSVMAFGVLNTTYTVLLKNFSAGYERAEPVQAILTLPDFDEDLVEKVRSLPEVKLAEGRRQFYLKLESGGKPRLINTNASLEPANNRISRLAWEGAPPAELQEGEVLLDRTFKALLPVSLGQTFIVQDLAGHSHYLKVAGLPNDLTSIPGRFVLLGQAFISLDTAVYLGQERDYNQLWVVTHAAGKDRDALLVEIQRQATRIVDCVEDAGYPVLAVEIPVPGQPPLESVVRTLLLALQLFGFLIVILAVLVVSNVAAALIAEQTRQVGILKAVGSRSSGVLRIYSQMVLIIGGSALVIALPLVWILSRMLVNLLARMIDAQLMEIAFPLSTWIILPVLAFGATFAAVIRPLWRASHLSVRQAISDDLPRAAENRAVLNVGSLLVRNSLRVLLGKRQRLVFNLLMLGLSGAMFVAALNVRSEVKDSVDRVQLRRNYDIQVRLSEMVKRSVLEKTALKVPEVSAVEGFIMSNIGRILPDGTTAGSVTVLAHPAGSDYTRPWLVSGQWPVQPNGLLLSAEVLDMWGLAKAQPIPLGLPTTVTAAGREASDWVLDGTLGKLNLATVYASYEDFATLTRQEGQVNMLAVRLAPGVDGLAATDRLLNRLERHGYSVLRIDYLPPMNAAEMASYSMVVFILFVVVGLTAVVGGLGLLSTLSISVMERRREIGILRSMGSRPALIRRLVMTEGLLTALLSLPLSYLLSWPLTLILGKTLVMGITSLAPEAVYRLDAALIWAVLVCSLALLSSWAPARQASRLSIRETLIYQG